MRVSLLIYFAVITPFVSLSCGSPENDFKKAKAKNTTEAYKEYLEKYPDTLLKSEIEDSICSLDFREAISENTFEAYELFMDKYQDSEFQEKVKTKILSFMGSVKGTFVNRYTNRPVDLEPILFSIFGDDQTEEEVIEKAEERFKKYERWIDIKIESSGNFLITNVLQGEYKLMVKLPPSYRHKFVGSVFEVSRGQFVDLGKIEIDIK